jgi:hypothetical protein
LQIVYQRESIPTREDPESNVTVIDCYRGPLGMDILAGDPDITFVMKQIDECAQIAGI